MSQIVLTLIAPDDLKGQDGDCGRRTAYGVDAVGRIASAIGCRILLRDNEHGRRNQRDETHGTEQGPSKKTALAHPRRCHAPAATCDRRCMPGSPLARAHGIGRMLHLSE
jgi:hypothetical protein